MQRVQGRLRRLVKPLFLWWFLIVVGVVLRLRQYLSDRSLWADEASLAYNLANRNFVGLTQPLDYEQGAPIGFLFIEKLFVVLLGNRDQVMRLFPLLSGIIAVYLFYRIARDHIKGGMLASFLFAIGWSLIYYSSELKQYSSDVMIGLLLVFLAIHCLKENVQSRDFLLLGIAGAVAIWISHPSAFILAGIGLALFVATITRNPRIPLPWLAGLAAIWILSFGAQYVVSLRHLIADEYLQSYWQKAFMPFPPWGQREWFVRTYYSVLLTGVNRTDLIMILGIPLLTLLGALSLLYREREIALMIISPFFIALFASALERYPFKDRFILFLVPFLLLLIAEGFGFIYALMAKWHPGIAHLVYALLVIAFFVQPAISAVGGFLNPYDGADIKPVLEYVAKNRAGDEIIYVFHVSDPAFHYYAPLYGLDGPNVLIGYDTPRKKVALQGFLEDVKKLRGYDRVWFLFSEVADCGDCEGGLQFYENYLNESGTMLDSFQATGANAFLYDMNP